MERLKELRKNAKLNQKQVADVLGLTVSAYGNYELGQREPNIESLCKLADYYGVSVDYLIGHVSNPLADRPMSDVAENFIREYGEMFSDETFRNYARLYKVMDARQRIFVLGMIVGWLKDQGVTIKNL